MDSDTERGTLFVLSWGIVNLIVLTLLGSKYAATVYGVLMGLGFTQWGAVTMMVLTFPLVSFTASLGLMISLTIFVSYFLTL